MPTVAISGLRDDVMLNRPSLTITPPLVELPVAPVVPVVADVVLEAVPLAPPTPVAPLPAEVLVDGATPVLPVAVAPDAGGCPLLAVLAPLLAPGSSDELQDVCIKQVPKSPMIAPYAPRTD